MFRAALSQTLIATAVLVGSVSIPALAVDDAKSTPRTAVITLKDQSQIVGKFIEMKDGKYRVFSDSLGEVTIEDGKVKNIEFLEPGETAKAPDKATATDKDDVKKSATPAVAATDAKLNETVEGLAVQALQDPVVVQQIQSLLEDPMILDLFENEEFAAAAESGDYAKMMQSKALQAIVDSPQMKTITNQVTGKTNEPAAPKAPAKDAANNLDGLED